MMGHLFIVDGNLTKIACDALLIPTDPVFNITAGWESALANREIPTSWKASSVLPLDHVPREPWIWLGNIGLRGDAYGFEAYEPVIREFVAKAANALKSIHDDKRIYHWPKHRLALNVVGSGYGGGSQKKGDLIRGLVGALQQLAMRWDIDIVLVTFGQKPYAAAQRARRQLVSAKNLQQTWRFGPHTNPVLIAEAHRLAEAAIDSQLVLFIGAGVSAGAGLPTWDALLSNIAIEAGIDSEILALLAKKDLRDQATIIERRLQISDLQLRQRVAANLTTRQRYSLQHALLASLTSREAITTNFDTLFESAARTYDRGLAVLPEDPSSTGGRWLLKLHGSVDDPDNMVLTRSDYLELPRRYGALIGLVQGLLLMRHMMFVGYSLQDEDFHELIHEVRSAKGGSSASTSRGTVLTLFDDGLERELWEDDLHIVPITTHPATNAGVAEAARQLEVFLDLVGFLSTTSAAFFLDQTYDTLSSDEAPLRSALTNLLHLTRGAGHDSVAHKVTQFLTELGVDEPDGPSVGKPHQPG